ncbi:hypothetical protein UPYG_G00219420 [Umbra pygmaea]|uniref:Uncharacterized protein n=1 Tax=Umbra pygmaea TaxID=75934 RepID=A0ABD0X3H2_UMBPY
MIGPTGRITNLLLLLLLRGNLSTSFSQLRTPLHYDDTQEHSSWSSQNLSSVPEVLDVRLMHLDLSRNFIRHINSPGLYLPSLKTLDLSYNQLQTITEGAFRDVTKLQELNVARNLLSHNVDGNSQALGSLNRLRRLDLSMNGLDDDAAELYLRKKSVLEHLDLTGNLLMQLAPKQFADSRSLRSINMENNLITVIEKGTFEPLKKLETLNLAKNNLVYICDFKLHQIKLLNLSRNSIEVFFTSTDGQMYNLEILDLSYNKLLYFPMIPTTNQLRSLHLQSNMLGFLEADTMLSEASSLYRELKADDVNDAVEYDIYSNWRMMPLTSIDLSSNHFRSFPVEAVSQLTSLSTLNLSNNCIQAISYNMTKNGGGHGENFHPPSLTFPSLRFFSLQNNGLWQLSLFFLENLPSIETLNLRQNAEH